MEQNINADHNNDILLIFAVLRGKHPKHLWCV